MNMNTTLAHRTYNPSWLRPFWRDHYKENFFARLWPDLASYIGGDWTPKFDFFEKDGYYHLKAEIPGMLLDDISVSVHDGFMTLSGRKEDTREDDESDLFTSEIRYDFFSRSFRMPGEMDEDKVNADYEDGVLTVSVPKKEDAKAKKVVFH